MDIKDQAERFINKVEVICRNLTGLDFEDLEEGCIYSFLDSEDKEWHGRFDGKNLVSNLRDGGQKLHSVDEVFGIKLAAD